MSTITRTGTTQRWSDTVSYQGLIFLCEVPDDLSQDIRGQTQQVLNALHQRLLACNSDTSRMLNATIYIPYPEDLAAFNELWDAWVPQGHAPVRACIHAPLTRPEMRVEIQLAAAVST